MITTIKQVAGLLIVVALLFGCKSQERIITHFSEVPIPQTWNAAEMPLFQEGAYVYKVQIDSAELKQESRRASRLQLAEGVKDNHIASSLWFLDEVRFIQLSDFYRISTESIDSALNMNSKYRQGKYHVGNYEKQGDTLLLHYLKGNSHKTKTRIFDIKALVQGDSITFIQYDSIQVEYATLSGHISLETLFPQRQVYVFDQKPKTIQLYDSFFLEKVELYPGKASYVVCQLYDPVAGKFMRLKANRKKWKKKRKPK